MLVWPVESLGWIIANGQEAMTAADRVQEVLDTPPQIVDRPHAVTVSAAETVGAVRFEGVMFGYPDARESVLRGVDLTVRPGETLAVVGVTGSGKTTPPSLVPRERAARAARVAYHFARPHRPGDRPSAVHGGDR